MNWELGIDVLILILITILGFYLCRFWLIKIYNRVRQIAKILENCFLRRK